MQPLSLLLPTFAALSGLVVIAVILEIFTVCDVGRRRRTLHTERSFQDFLLSSLDAPSRDSTSRVPASKWLRISAFCIVFLRGVAEAGSSYMLLPTVFVFVVNVWPTSFAQASTLQRVINIAMPVIALLLRVFVIRRRFVEMSHNDQVVLYVQSIINCSVSVALGVYFIKKTGIGAKRFHRSCLTWPPNTSFLRSCPFSSFRSKPSFVASRLSRRCQST